MVVYRFTFLFSLSLPPVENVIISIKKTGRYSITGSYDEESIEKHLYKILFGLMPYHCYQVEIKVLDRRHITGSGQTEFFFVYI